MCRAVTNLKLPNLFLMKLLHCGTLLGQCLCRSGIWMSLGLDKHASVCLCVLCPPTPPVVSRVPSDTAFACLLIVPAHFVTSQPTIPGTTLLRLRGRRHLRSRLEPRWYQQPQHQQLRSWPHSKGSFYVIVSVYHYRQVNKYDYCMLFYLFFVLFCFACFL